MIRNIIYKLRKKLISWILSKKIHSKGSIFFYGKKAPIIRGRNIFVGENFRINEYSYLSARGKSKIVIGNSVTISSFAKLITASYDIEQYFNIGKNTNNDIHKEEDIYLGNNCWVGAGAIILGGVRLEGDNVIVAAGAIVTKSFKGSNLILGGIPARIIKSKT